MKLPKNSKLSNCASYGAKAMLNRWSHRRYEKVNAIHFWETQAPDKTMFGIDRTVALVQAHRHEPAESIVGMLYDEACRFAQDQPQQDDTAIVVIKVVTDELEPG